MKYFLISLLLSHATIAIGQEENAVNWNELTLNITNIDPHRSGEIVVMVFQYSGFPKDHTKAIKKYNFVAMEPHYQLSIQVPDGKFALKIHHDEDKSGTMTKNWTGIIPAEGVGFSSNAKVRFGPPSFKAAQMEQPKNNTVDIAIIYP